MTEWPLWLYVLVMAGSVAWFRRWSRDPKHVPQAAYRLVIAILLWSGVWHLIMALGLGRIEVAERPVHWARYLDWLVTAPLLVIALVLTGTHGVREKRRKLLTVMVGACVLMIVSGLAADLIADRMWRFAVYGIGVLPLLVLLGLIFGPVRATAARQPRAMASLYTTLAFSLSALWAAFPLVWILGPSGIGLLGEFADTTLFLGLSVLMKVVWSLVDIGRLRTLADRGELSVLE